MPGAAPGAPGMPPLAAPGAAGAAVCGGFLGITMLIGTTGELALDALACGPTAMPVALDPATDDCGKPVADMEGPVTCASGPQPKNARRVSHRALVRNVVIFQPFETSRRPAEGRAQGGSASTRQR